MTYVLPILMLFIGIAIGAVAAWFVMRARSAQAVERARGAIEAERATLAERLDGREQMIAQLRPPRLRRTRDAADFGRNYRDLTEERR